MCVSTCVKTTKNGHIINVGKEELEERKIENIRNGNSARSSLPSGDDDDDDSRRLGRSVSGTKILSLPLFALTFCFFSSLRFVCSFHFAVHGK